MIQERKREHKEEDKKRKEEEKKDIKLGRLVGRFEASKKVVEANRINRKAE